MGRIKSALAKRTAERLIEDENLKFSENFGENKQILGNFLPSKRIRNIIAGYISRLKKHAKQELQA